MPEEKEEARRKDREKIQELELTLFELRGGIGAGRHVRYHKIVLTTAGTESRGATRGGSTHVRVGSCGSLEWCLIISDALFRFESITDTYTLPCLSFVRTAPR
jgi:hypothetical protein